MRSPMSVEFTLSNCPFTPGDWDSWLDAWGEGREFLQEPYFQDGVAHILVEGSTRGCLFSRAGDDVHVRLGAMSSRLDWRMTYEIVRGALAEGGTFTREDGVVFTAAELTDEAADALAVTDFCFSVDAVKRSLGDSEQSSVQLPHGAFNLQLAASDLPETCGPEEVPAVEALLAAQVSRYAPAYRPMTMVLEGGARVTSWARIPTLIGKAHLVGIESLDNPVPRDKVLEILGDRAEQVGDGVYYLPELDLEADSELFTALRAESVDVAEFVTANADRIAAEAEEEAERQAAQVSPDALDDPTGEAAMRPFVELVATAMRAAQGPAEVSATLVGAGLSPELADGFVGVVIEVISRLTGEGPQTAEAIVEGLVKEGVPTPIAFAALRVVVELNAGDGGPQTAP